MSNQQPASQASKDLETVETTEMGRIVVEATLTNSTDLGAVDMGWLEKAQVRSLQARLLVDTGAAMLSLPPQSIQTLGLEPRYERSVMTANGRVKRTIYSPVFIHVMSQSAHAEVMEVPPGTPPLLGYLVLEALELHVDPTNQTLGGNPAYGGAFITDQL